MATRNIPPVPRTLTKCLFVCSLADSEYYASLEIPLSELEQKVLETILSDRNDASTWQDNHHLDHSVGWILLWWATLRKETVLDGLKLTRAFKEGKVWKERNIFGNWRDSVPEEVSSQMLEIFNSFVDSHKFSFLLDAAIPRRPFFDLIQMWQKPSTSPPRPDLEFFQKIESPESEDWLMALTPMTEQKLYPPTLKAHHDAIQRYTENYFQVTRANRAMLLDRQPLPSAQARQQPARDRSPHRS